MKRFLLRLLPLMAAVTLATSCSKDDDNNAPEKKQNASPQEKTIIYNPDGTVTIPYSIKYSTGKSLDKKMTYNDDGTVATYEPTEDDEIIVSGEGVSGKLTLQYELSDFGDEDQVFKGELTATSVETATKLKNNEITLTYEYGTALEEPASSNVSLKDLMESCNHLYTATGNYSDKEFTLSDQNTYLAISMSPCCNHDITINDKDFTVEDGRIWIAVPGGKPVKSTGLGTELDKAANEVVPGTIHTVARQYFTVHITKTDSKKVYFSKGNLQYNPAAGQWRFAEHQYDCCVTVNGGITGGDITAWYNTDTKYNGWIDLFGWGMWLDGDGNDPLRIAKDGEYYPTIETKNFKYMSLSDNPVIGSEWTTLTAGQNGSKKEWDLLLAHLKDVNGFGGGQITTEEGVMVHGIILLPDDWSLPNGIKFNSCKQNAVSFIDNKYTVTEWKKMEANGAVFMPAAGRAVPSNGEVSLSGFNDNCYYWTSTAANDDNDNAYIISAHEKFFYQSNVYRYFGLSVRLVRPL